MGYAEVCVSSPATRNQTFSYAIPSGLGVSVGQAVWVPFGRKLLQGIVIELTDTPAVAETREIAGVIDTRPLLSPEHVALARWLQNHYLSSLSDAVALMLPPGFERKTLTYISASNDIEKHDLSSLNGGQSLILEMLKKREVPLNAFERALGKKAAQAAIAQMARLGLITRNYRPEPVRVKPKRELFLKLSVDAGAVSDAITALTRRRAAKQATLLGFMAQQKGLIAWTEARERTGCDRNVLNMLVKKGLITLQEIETKREPVSYRDITPSRPLTLTDAQQCALDSIKTSLQRIKDGASSPDIFLLHGVTGSGKTEIYLQALSEAVKLGKRGIVLVPEISLTPQIIERFAARFPGRVALLHSRLSLGEQYDEWRRIRNAGADVVIGPRSALFAPQPELGLIVIDEEHEWSYKQQDRPPYYHARDAAIKLAGLTRSAVILGSATPDVSTYYHAQKGHYRLLSLPERVSPHEGSPLPQVHIVDMREELKAGNRSLLSRFLTREIQEALSRKEQVILFLNRRGAATFIQCRRCGMVLRCRRCQVALSYHATEEALVCHQCNYHLPVPDACPRCRSRRLNFLGAGSEKLEHEVNSIFPEARLLRWDSDTTKEKHSHETIAGKFRDHEADILVGTQMVASGLDLPGVTLVGAVSADSGLNLPDFRAVERTFQLLSQVAGRAGRGTQGGKVIIQTYSPANYAVQAASRHDYRLFYHQEMDYRRRLHNPPLSQLACLTCSQTNNDICREAAARMKRRLTQEKDTRGTTDISIIGPAPAYLPQLRGRFRWQLILRGSKIPSFLSQIPIPSGWTVNIDPLGLV
ncbi:MAG: primosomal protein N' [Chloroflexota bacterium]